MDTLKNTFKPQRKLKDEELYNLLKKDSVAQIVLSKQPPLNEDDLVGVRLNLNLLKFMPGQILLTLHKGTTENDHTKNRSFFKGEAIGYAEAVWIYNAFFNVNQLAREQIASGMITSFAMASIDGNFQSKEIPENFSGIEIKFNPKIGHWFTDVEGFAIRYAEEVVVIGNRAYACGKIVYYSEENAPKKMGDSPSLTKFKSLVNSECLYVPKKFVKPEKRPEVF